MNQGDTRERCFDWNTDGSGALETRQLRCRRLWKIAVLGMAFCICLLGSLMTVYGASQSSIIEKMSVTLKSSYGEEQEILEPAITISAAGCTIEDYQYGTEYEDWKPGKKVRIEINIKAPEGKYFPSSMNNSECKVTGADYVSAKAVDDTTLQVKVNYYPVMVLGTPEKPGWSSKSSDKATWRAVKYAPGYSLTLYADNKVVKRLTVETNSADLSEYMQNLDKTYYYEVKAIPLTSEEKKYLKEGYPITSSEQEYDWDAEGEDPDEVYDYRDGGSLKGTGYVLPDGTKAKNVWKKVRENWYYFDENGNRKTGWLQYGGHWYYFSSTGQMQTGWLQDGGSKFYLSPDGDMRTGWVETEPRVWHYFASTGQMQTGWVWDGRNWYHMAQSGQMETGWIKDGDCWYYLTSLGQMLTGWQNVGGVWYYLYSDGVMAANTVIDGWTIGVNGVAYQ